MANETTDDPWVVLGFAAWFRALPLSTQQRVKDKARWERVPLIAVCMEWPSVFAPEGE